MNIEHRKRGRPQRTAQQTQQKLDAARLLVESGALPGPFSPSSIIRHSTHIGASSIATSVAAAAVGSSGESGTYSATVSSGRSHYNPQNIAYSSPARSVASSYSLHRRSIPYPAFDSFRRTSSPPSKVIQSFTIHDLLPHANEGSDSMSASSSSITTRSLRGFSNPALNVAFTRNDSGSARIVLSPIRASSPPAPISHTDFSPNKSPESNIHMVRRSGFTMDEILQMRNSP